MIGRNDACWCGSGKKWKQCHYPKSGEDMVSKKPSMNDALLKKHHILIKDDKHIEGIRASCKLASQILEETCNFATKGVTTKELNDFAQKLHEAAGAIPAPLGYGQPPFPKSICTSVNDVICHGIPGEYALQEGDILNIDVTTILEGYYGDCSKMVVIGTTTPERQLVVDVAYECLMRAIEVLKPGISVSAIGNAIEPYANSKGCSVVNQFVGHGVGIEFHEGPQILHSKNHLNIPLRPGMTFTIEPMINAGVRDAVIDETDEWTARTADGKDSAQWEHTVLITDTGHEILTTWKR